MLIFYIQFGKTMVIPKLKILQNASSGTKKILKPILIVILGILFAAFGLEASNNDWDLGKLFSGSSWSEAKVMRDKDGNVVTDGGKYTNEYNCSDFDTQLQAQKFFNNAGGSSEDTNDLDRDNDGEACEELPAK